MADPVPFPEFARKLCAAMKAAHVRPSELAVITGADRGTVARWRAGKLYPGRRKLRLIAERLGQPVDYFIEEGAPVVNILAYEPAEAENRAMTAREFATLTAELLEQVAAQVRALSERVNGTDGQ